MLKEIRQVLRALMLLGKERQQHSLKNAGGLLVLLCSDSPQRLMCTVAAAGPWCTGIKMEALQPVLTGLKDSMFPSVGPCLLSDPEELCAFTDLYGPLRLLLSFQTNDAAHFRPDWCVHIETFLHTFCLVNAGITIHLKFNSSQRPIQETFSAKIKSKVALPNQPSLMLDVTCDTQPPVCVKQGRWCKGGHPVTGGRFPLSIPPDAMDRGLFGELSVQIVTILSPCVMKYPNLATRLTHIQVLVSSPSNIPVTGPSTFFQNLPSHLDCQDVGLQGLRCSSSKDLVRGAGTVYKVLQENWEDQEQDFSVPSMPQRLLVFLFLQHSDQFTCQLPDVMATEVLIERHLEDILNNNRHAVTAAFQKELKKILKAETHRENDQEKLCSAIEVILGSSISIVSSSSNMDFRQACLNSMKVHDTHQLSASLRESLRMVTLWKCIPKSRCFSAYRGELSEADQSTRKEM